MKRRKVACGAFGRSKAKDGDGLCPGRRSGTDFSKKPTTGLDPRREEPGELVKQTRRAGRTHHPDELIYGEAEDGFEIAWPLWITEDPFALGTPTANL